MKSAVRRLVTIAVSAVAIGGGAMTLAASPASADNVDRWGPGWTQPCLAWCLYYSPGLYNGGLMSYYKYYTLQPYSFTNQGVGTLGVGEPVRNNAAAIGSKVNCRAATFVYENYMGPNNWVSPGWAGNLNSSLRNNENSVRWDTCS